MNIQRRPWHVYSGNNYYYDHYCEPPQGPFVCVCACVFSLPRRAAGSRVDVGGDDVGCAIVQCNKNVQPCGGTQRDSRGEYGFRERRKKTGVIILIIIYRVSKHSCYGNDIILYVMFAKRWPKII